MGLRRASASAFSALSIAAFAAVAAASAFWWGPAPVNAALLFALACSACALASAACRAAAVACSLAINAAAFFGSDVTSPAAWLGLG